MVQDVSAPYMAFGGLPKPARDKTVASQSETAVASPKPSDAGGGSDWLEIAVVMLVVIAGLLVVGYIWRGRRRGLESAPRARSAERQPDRPAGVPVHPGSRPARRADDDRARSTTIGLRRPTAPVQLVTGTEHAGAAAPRRDAASFDG